MRSVDDNRSSSSTLSAAPSLSSSKISLGATSHCSQKSTCSQKSHVSAEKPLTREEIIAAYLEKAKWYTSVGLGELFVSFLLMTLTWLWLSFVGTTAILSVFAFLFLIPFVVDPAISAITADFDPGEWHICRWVFRILLNCLISIEPVTCVVSDHTYSEGIKNCTWSSCREGKNVNLTRHLQSHENFSVLLAGCTTAQTRCHQLLVNYTKIPYKDWIKAPVDLELVDWDVADTKFLINTEGCGYPNLGVNCSIFAKQFGWVRQSLRRKSSWPENLCAHFRYENVRVTTFPCYYSRAFNQIVVARYSWDDNLKHLILSIIIPNVLFAVSIGVLSYWYCPCCDKACHNKNPRVYAEFPTAKEK